MLTHRLIISLAIAKRHNMETRDEGEEVHVVRVVQSLILFILFIDETNQDQDGCYVMSFFSFTFLLGYFLLVSE